MINAINRKDFENVSKPRIAIVIGRSFRNDLRTLDFLYFMGEDMVVIMKEEMVGNDDP